LTDVLFSLGRPSILLRYGGTGVGIYCQPRVGSVHGISASRLCMFEPCSGMPLLY
jgi:hypothetical protein